MKIIVRDEARPRIPQRAQYYEKRLRRTLGRFADHIEHVELRAHPQGGHGAVRHVFRIAVTLRSGLCLRVHQERRALVSALAAAFEDVQRRVAAAVALRRPQARLAL